MKRLAAAIVVLCALASAHATSATPRPRVLVVPDVRGQPYVIAKGLLEDAGFAWRVRGPVRGFAANHVASQWPRGGRRVYDTGSPRIELRLSSAGRNAERGRPEQRSPFRATSIWLVRPAGHGRRR